MRLNRYPGGEPPEPKSTSPARGVGEGARRSDQSTNLAESRPGEPNPGPQETRVGPGS